ncbi:TPA: hypothetical protein OOF48_003010 [Providencia rettgeri]|nr:hypothetical protein [Providencia rettgeri]
MTVKYLVPMLGAILCTNSFADELILGAGVGMSSPYEGSDKYILIPDATIQYTVWYI